jgi:hypothetical protein
MADKTVEINLTTTADTAGAVKTAAALQSVGDAGKRLADESRARAAAEASLIGKNAEADKKALAAKALAGVALATAFHSAAQGIAMVSAEVDKLNLKELALVNPQGAADFGAFKQTLSDFSALVNNPLSLTIGKIINLEGIQEAIGTANESTAALLKQREDTIKRIVGAGKEDVDALAERLKTWSQDAEWMASTREAQLAAKNRGRAGEAAGLDAEGKPTEGLKAEGILQSSTDKIDTLSESLGRLKIQLESAEAAAERAANELAKIETRGSETPGALKTAQESLAKALSKVTSLKESYETAQETIGQKISSAKDSGAQAMEELARAGGKSVTEAAVAAIEAIRASAKQGENVTPIEGVFSSQQPSAKAAAIAGLQGITGDKNPDAGQAGEVATIMGTLKTSLTAKDAALIKTLEDLVRTANAQMKLYTSIQEQVQSLAERISQMN